MDVRYAGAYGMASAGLIAAAIHAEVNAKFADNERERKREEEFASWMRCVATAAEKKIRPIECPWKPCNHTLCAEFGRPDCDSHDDAEREEADALAEARGGATS